jgi:hypothetical protein
VPLNIFEAAERGKLTLVQSRLETISRKKLLSSTMPSIAATDSTAHNDEKEALLPRDFKAYLDPNSTNGVMSGALEDNVNKNKALGNSWGSTENNLRGSGDLFKVQEIITDLNNIIERQRLVARRRALAESDSHGRTALVSSFLF